MKAMLNDVICCLILSSAALALTPPLITHQPERLYEYSLGETLTLQCSASGNPAPTYTWSHDDVDIAIGAPSAQPGARTSRFALSPGSGDLVITDSRSHDQGYYKCKATNELGTAVSDTAQLVRAVLENFGRQGGGDVIVNLGDSVSLTCAPRLPACYPPPFIYWSKRLGHSGAFVPMVYSDRISQDPSGGLHIASVITEDSRMLLNCIFDNKQLQQIAAGPDYKIVLKPQSASSSGSGGPLLGNGTTGSKTTPPSLLYPSKPNTTMTIIEHRELRLKCIFGGNPTPKVTWSKSTGTPMSDKSAVDPSGLELVIISAAVTDAGTYECRGDNGQLPFATARIEVTVNVPPRIISKPEPVVKGENETVTFTCEGSGIPRPTTTWFINGKPITGRQRTTVNGSRLIITELKLADTAAIQCNVSHNETGWDAVSFYLLVRNEPPRITAPQTSMMKLAEGNGARFVCQASGHPAPSIRWQKDGLDVATPGATLSIVQSKVADTGIYTCVASNGVGRATFNLTLYVRHPTRIVVPPQDQTIGAGEEAWLECQVITDPDEMEHLEITWQKNHAPIDFGKKEHENKRKDTTSLRITGAQVRDSGIYTCTARNGIDEAEATGNLIVQGVPDAPTEVNIAVCASNYAELQWLPGSENNAAILDYRVEYRSQYDNQWIEEPKDTPTPQHRISLHRPWSNYTFRVKARNSMGFSEASLPTVTSCTTSPDVPSKNPVGVRTLDEEPTNLVIAWQPMTASDHNGPGFYYEINYTRQDPETKLFTCPPDSRCHQTYAGDNSGSGTDMALTEHRLTLTDQPVFTAYNISIRARNAQGPASVTPEAIIGHTGEGTPVAEVDGFILDPAKGVAARNASFIWTHVNTDPQIIRGLFKGYRIRYWREGHEQEKHSVTIVLHEPPHRMLFPPLSLRLRKRATLMDGSNGSHVYATIGQLPPYTQLHFAIAVLNRRHAGKESKPISIRTRAAAPGAVSDIITKEVGPTFVVVEWGSPMEPNGEITGYNIVYQLVMDDIEQPSAKTAATLQYAAETRRGRLANLLPKQTYRITIVAFTEAGPGTESSVDVTTSSQGYPDAPTVRTAIDSGCGGCLNVSWTPANTGVAASSFYVEHRQEGGNPWFETAADAKTNWIILTNLSRGIYEVRVVASNGKDFRTPSETTRINLNVPAPAEAEEPRTVFASAWFIGLICGVAALIILIIAAIFFYRQRQAGRYSIKETHETEKLKPEDDDGCSSRAYPSNSGQPRRTCGELDLDGMPKACENGRDDNSEDEFQDEDATKFDEDGSFIQAYREDKLDDNRDQQSSNDRLPTSSSGTNAKDDRTNIAPSPSPRSSPQLSTFQQHLSKSSQQPNTRSNDSSTAASRNGSSNALQQTPALGGTNKASSLE